MSVTYRENNNIGFIEFDQPGSKVNLLTAETLKRLEMLLDEVRSKASLEALVFLSKKKDVFIAGADIKEIEHITDAGEGEKKSKSGQDILNKLEDLTVPTLAVIDGVALGGGCELALACQYRLATFNEKVKIGLPEVSLGIIPGFGGTYRLPRLVGLAEGLKMILSGKPVDGANALKISLVDRLVPSQNLDYYLDEFINDVRQGKFSSHKYARRKKKGLAAILGESFLARRIAFHQSRQSALKLTKGFYPAPLKAIDVVQAGIHLTNRQKGMDLESKAFGALAVTEISKNLIHVFYISEKYRKLSLPAGQAGLSGAEDIVPRKIRKCAVLGAGVMGGGIAQLLSSQDIWVRLKDIRYEALALGLKSAHKIFQQALQKRRLKKHEVMAQMARITPTLDYSGFKNIDMAIEAVVEDLNIKEKVFSELAQIVGAQTILATNTSALSVTAMAQKTKDPSKVIGLHFFNPVHRMPLVEVIATSLTSRETIATTLNLAKQLGKTPIIVKDSCGFLVNRILLSYMNEAGRLLEEGGRQTAANSTSGIARIDKVMTDFGMPMGPFSLSDEVGLDVGIKVLHILEDGLGERFKPNGIFEKIYAQGLLGKKSGKGFYIYAKRRRPNPQVQKLLSGKSKETFDADEALKRMVYIMVNEAARCLEEKIVEGPDTIDAGMIFGTGFPPFRGGLLKYADTVGIAAIVHELERLWEKWEAERFRPAPYLLKLKEQNRKFYT